MFNKKKEVRPDHKSIETIIGPSVKVDGTFSGEGDLIIEGILVGKLTTKRNLKVGSSAVVEANIKANNAFISGKVKGNIMVKGKLEVTGSGVIDGDIKAQIVSIESGAMIKGNIDMPISEISAKKIANDPEDVVESKKEEGKK